MNDDKDKAGLRKSNLRMALVLASIALVFFLGFIGKMVFLNH